MQFPGRSPSVVYGHAQSPTICARPGRAEYNFLRLGREGYRRIMMNLRTTADYLAERLATTGRFTLLGDRRSLPLVAFRLAEPRPYTVYDIAERLRAHGWIVPAYHLPANAEEVVLLRVVVREHLSRDMADMLLDDLTRVLERLDAVPAPAPAAPAPKASSKMYKVC
jgi:glutamate decarboxylase